MAKICKNCGCYEVCIFANPYRTEDCNAWQPIIVQCKDCKHWQPIHERIPHMECQIFCGAYEHGYPTNADDFCSYGEKR